MQLGYQRGVRMVTGLVLGATILSAGIASAEPSFSSLTDEEHTRVQNGEVVVKVEKTSNPLKHFMVVGMVNAPAAQVFRVFTDYEHYADIFGLKDTQILKRDGETLDIKAVIGLPWPFGETWVVNQTTLIPDAYSFVYHRVDGSIREYTGSLKVVPVTPDTSEVYYVAKTDPGIPLLPTWLLNRFQASMLPSSIESVRKWIKKHQTEKTDP